MSSPPTVAKTVAPKACASWIAVVPIPDEPPWTRKLSPGCRRPRSNTLAQTVKKVSGMPPASIMPTPGGTGSTWGAGAVQYSA